MHLAGSVRRVLPLALWACAARGELKIIGAGLPRTGTESLAGALQQLGYVGVVHDYCNPPTECQRASCDWLMGGSAEPVINEVQTKGWEVVTDEPLGLLYEPLAKAFPNAKVILTVRDTADQWYQSFARMQEYIWGLRVQLGRLEPYAPDLTNSSSLDSWSQCDQAPHAAYGCPIFSSVQTEQVQQGCLNGYEAYNAAVRRAISPDRLLVFNVKEGWGPLCKFLGLPVPEQPFPLNNTYMNSLQVQHAMEEPIRRHLRRHMHSAAP
mmetsp:Transcript_1139/g.3163  ORF Transcript_1139/g.3163 Transcript_1139/m.3163 type:complete len:266 (-) Transcript_1139:61-858(-)